MTMCTVSPGKSFGPGGCQVPIGSGTCGETRTLEIVDEFRRLYEERIQLIDSTGGGDCLEEKIKLQQDWIGDLTAQNEMLVRAVEELEHEATERVHVLEEKLEQSAQSICEVMKRYREYDVTNDLLAEPLQKVFCMESDQKNLLEFIRRVREENRWDVNGLKFYGISYQDLFGSTKKDKAESIIEYKNSDSAKRETKLQDNECCLQSLQKKLDYYNKFGDVESLSKELECKKEECLSLQRSMKDTQQALVEEVASKHDAILQLRKECQQLEERCVQADKQTAFRDDIIKELRKEIKQLKQQKCECTEENVAIQKKKLLQLENEIDLLGQEKRCLQKDKSCLLDEMRCLEKERAFLEEKNNYLEKDKDSLEYTIRENKCQVDSLGKEFQEFLKVKHELKRITKITEKKCNEIRNKNRKLKTENRHLKADIECLENINKQLERDLKATRDALEPAKCDTENCKQKTQEYDKLLQEMLNLNDENRGLLKTVENQRKRIDRTTKLTQEEIIKLSMTIDELQNDLQRTKNLQEQEERRNEEKIHRLKETIKDLVCSLNQAETKYEKEAKICKICRGRTKVGFAEHAEVQACIDVAESEEQMETMLKRDDIIRVQTDTLNILQMEVETLKEQESELRRDRDRKCCDIQILKNRVSELEDALDAAEGKAANLQTAIDLYLNSINVLEETEDKCKVEIEQQKLTISNLQRALVATKQELDEIKQKSQENEHDQHGLISCFNNIMSDVGCDKENLAKQCECLIEEYEQLQDVNFDLEVDHCTSLQDVEILENQLIKYQTLLRSSEDECNHYKHYCKKLSKQKRCYEEVVTYFKQEMASMSEQLCNLQELLSLSNESCQEETCKLMNALVTIQAENEQLSHMLAAAEQKAVLECQMNELHETKISELQQLISDRELDLSRHDQAILNIRQSLQCSLTQNEELQSTIVELHETIAQLQNAVQMYETDNSRGKEGTEQCWAQILSCKQKLDELKCALDEKTRDLCKLEMAYNDQTRALKSAQMELKEIREKQKDKQRHLKATVEELRQKLGQSEENYCKVCCDLSNLQTQLGALVRKEAVKDQEVKRYRKIVCDLKNTLIDLNKSLASNTNTQKLQIKCNHSECRKSIQLTEEAKNQDICFKCPCEVEFYQSIVETLKKSVIDLKKQLAETQDLNQQLEESSHCKDRECIELRKKLTEKLKHAQMEECHYSELSHQLEKELNTIRQELDIKTLQLNDVKKSSQEINSNKCIQLVCAQEEVNALKEELNRILRQQSALNAENEKLHAHSACLQSTVSKMEEKSHLLKGQLEQYLSELQSLQADKESLARKNCELLSELRSLQSTFNTSSKQQRYTEEFVKALEAEINDLKNYQDELCIESKNIITYVRAWQREQKKIDEQTAKREREYLDTIQRLKQSSEECPYTPPSQKLCKKVIVPCLKPSSPAPPTCPSPWSLGSQGTASIHCGRSSSRSPCPNEECDWYSPTFRNESDDDYEDEEDEEDWVTKVEHLAAQVRRTNKIWKNKMDHPDDVVSRDTKK